MSQILGIGTDLVELDRLERVYAQFETRFLDRICRPDEIKPRQGRALIQHIGGLFASKEATLKALGTGWGRGLGFRQIEVFGSATGGPGVLLHGKAAERANELGVERIHLSISHEGRYALAFAIAEGR